MIRRDYILGIIEELVGAIHRVLNLTTTAQYEAAHEEIERSLRELIGLDSDTTVRLSEQELIARLKILAVDEDWHLRCLLVATLLAAEGDIRARGRDGDAGYPFHLRALHLAILGRSIDSQDSSQVDMHSWPDVLLTVEQATAKLNDYRLPLETQITLLRHYHAQGKYAKAEDLLFAWLDEAPNEAPDEALIEGGTALYQSLLEQPDSVLEAGGLPRVEVEEALADLRARLSGRFKELDSHVVVKSDGAM